MSEDVNSLVPPSLVREVGNNNRIKICGYGRVQDTIIIENAYS